jgi:N-acetylglucosaminyldiphosphoundecaprenol N-acetyl-beta-D-mannosaminyltransferase
MRINLLGVSVDCQKKGEALRYVQERIAQKRPTRIYTPNPVIIQTAARNPVFRDVLNRADLNLPDGSGLLLAARILSLPLSERVAGIEFAEALLALAQQNGYGVFLFGGKPGVAHAAASRLKQRFPNLRICGARQNSHASRAANWQRSLKSSFTHNEEIPERTAREFLRLYYVDNYITKL